MLGRRWLLRLMLCAACGHFGAARAQESDAVTLLRAQEPGLATLYDSHSRLTATFARYAASQGFTGPIEALATIVHEEIHVASAEHQGFYVDGTYYEPYLASSAWPALRNQDLMGDHDIGPSLARKYLETAPGNTLGNVLDEINAYAHVAGFVCINEPATAGKQVRALRSFLALGSTYLRTTRISAPQEYMRLVSMPASVGAINLIARKAYATLARCGLNEPMEREYARLASLVRR